VNRFLDDIEKTWSLVRQNRMNDIANQELASAMIEGYRARFPDFMCKQSDVQQRLRRNRVRLFKRNLADATDLDGPLSFRVFDGGRR